jgi:hypothetical protein
MYRLLLALISLQVRVRIVHRAEMYRLLLALISLQVRVLLPRQGRLPVLAAVVAVAVVVLAAGRRQQGLFLQSGFLITHRPAKRCPIDIGIMAAGWW